MKKQLLIISIIVVIVSIFVSCSVNSCRDGACSIRNHSTTAVTDSNGTTHYYEPITDDKGNISTTAKNQGVFAEIETQSNGKAVTKKNGEYVTNEYTTALPIENTTDNLSSTTKKDGASPIPTKNSATDNASDADNTIDFEPDETTNKNTSTTDGASPIPTEKETSTTTQKETQPATDKDGWITKWY